MNFKNEKMKFKKNEEKQLNKPNYNNFENLENPEIRRLQLKKTREFEIVTKEVELLT